MRIFQHIFRIWCVFLIFDFFWRIFYSYTINLRTHWKSILKAIYSFILMLTWRISSRKNTFKKSSLELDKHSMRVEPLCHFESESESCSVMSDSLWPQGLYTPWNSPGQNTGVGSLSLLQGNLPNPEIKSRYPALQVDSLPAKSQGAHNSRGSCHPAIKSTSPAFPALQADSLASEPYIKKERTHPSTLKNFFCLIG